MSAAAVLHPVFSRRKGVDSECTAPVGKNQSPSRGPNDPAENQDQQSQPKRGEEQILVRRAMRGDSRAQDALFGRYRSRLYRLALRLLRSKEDAEDAVQDGLLSAYRNLGSFEGRSLFSTWLTRIVVNAALVRMRRQRARPDTFLQDISPEDPSPMANIAADSRPDPEQAYACFETQQLVVDALKELSPSVRSAFELRELRELSNTEAAEISGIRVGAFKSRISRARGQLAERFSPAAIAPLQKAFTSPAPPARRMLPEEPAQSYAG